MLFRSEALALVGSPLPLDPNPVLQGLQRFAIKLELENFGDEAIVLQANERVTETERVSAQQQLRARALRQDAEAQVAAQIIRDLQGTTRLVAAEVAPPAPLTQPSLRS